MLAAVILARWLYRVQSANRDNGIIAAAIAATIVALKSAPIDPGVCSSLASRLQRATQRSQRLLSQRTHVSGGSFDLRSGQTVRDWFHDHRRVRPRRNLTAFASPIRQHLDDISVELTRQTRKFSATGRIWAVARRTRRHIGVRNAVFENLASGGDEVPRSAPDRPGVEVVEALGKRIDHRRAQRVRDVEHDVVGAAMLGKGLQLVLQIFRLLSGKTRHRIEAAIALRRGPVTDLAIVHLGRELAARNARSIAALRTIRGREVNRWYHQGSQYCARDLRVSAFWIAGV